MKTMMMILSLVFSMSAMANAEMVKNVLGSKEVVELTTKLEEKGLNFLSIKYAYADKGMYPRCPCSSYELSL